MRGLRSGSGIVLVWPQFFAQGVLERSGATLAAQGKKSVLARSFAWGFDGENDHADVSFGFGKEQTLFGPWGHFVERLRP